MTFNLQSFDFSRIRMVVFDIDGTLADTAQLLPTGQRRVPHDILGLIGPSEAHCDALARIPNIRRLTSNLNRCGIRVAVISSAPAAYAGTSCFMLGVEADTIIAANNNQELRSKADRLLWLAEAPKWQYLKPSPAMEVFDLLYVGDMPEDLNAANKAGCHFQHMDDYLSDKSGSSPLAKLERLCEEIVSGVTSSSERTQSWQQRRFDARNHHQREVIEQLKSRNLFIDMSIPELMTDPDGLPGVFNPFTTSSPIQTPLIDPSFITREEYSQNSQLKSDLFLAISQEYGAHLQHFTGQHPFLARTKVFAHLKYWDSRLGQDLWRHIKSWQNMASGPEVNLLHLEFISLFMSASIWVEHNLNDPNAMRPKIVPVPSSPYSEKHPARASNRLARRISQLTNLHYVEVLEKRESQIRMTNEFATDLGFIILIDDQLTHGRTAEKAIATLSGHVSDIELRVWSSKHFKAEEPRSSQNENSLNSQKAPIDILKDNNRYVNKRVKTSNASHPVKERISLALSNDKLLEMIRSIMGIEIASLVQFDYFHIESSGRSGTLTLRVSSRSSATQIRPHLPMLANEMLKQTGPDFSLRIQVLGEFRKVLESLQK